MKIYHLADLHLAAPMVQLENKADERRNEIFDTLLRVVRHAIDNDVKVIMLSGDVFDNNRPYKRDKKRFYGIVQDHPDIDFLYLRGNHDTAQSYEEEIPNLLTFNSDKATTYSYGNVAITGLELNADNSARLAEMIDPDPDKYNIVMLHGQVNTGANFDRRAEVINLEALRNKGIDYLALGHYHTYQSAQLDERGVWAYCGCLEGRGYDETGEKGFVIVDTDTRTHEFVPFASRQVQVVDVDVSSAASIPDVIRMVSSKLAAISRDSMLKVELSGTTEFDPTDMARRVDDQIRGFYHHKVKDTSRRHISIEEYASRNSLVGEFVRLVEADSSLSGTDRQRILALGIQNLIDNYPA